MFGDNIWQVVNEYYATPKYVQGGDNTAWIAFKEKYPQYDQWRVWWYALMGNQELPSTRSYGGFYGNNGRGNGFSSGKGSTQASVRGVEAQVTPAARFQAPGSDGNWRKYFDPKVGIPNPRRR
jgi:hypothetical protein